MADSIADHSSILSAVFKAKADTKDGGMAFHGKKNRVLFSTSSDVPSYFFVKYAEVWHVEKVIQEFKNI